MQTVMSRTPLRHIGSQCDINDATTFPQSAKANYITGETIYVAGCLSDMKCTM